MHNASSQPQYTASHQLGSLLIQTAQCLQQDAMHQGPRASACICLLGHISGAALVGSVAPDAAGVTWRMDSCPVAARRSEGEPAGGRGLGAPGGRTVVTAGGCRGNISSWSSPPQPKQSDRKLLLGGGPRLL